MLRSIRENRIPGNIRITWILRFIRAGRVSGIIRISKVIRLVLISRGYYEPSRSADVNKRPGPFGQRRIISPPEHLLPFFISESCAGNEFIIAENSASRQIQLAADRHDGIYMERGSHSFIEIAVSDIMYVCDYSHILVSFRCDLVPGPVFNE